MEGNVYLCKWKKMRNGYKLWLVDHPKLSVTSGSIRSAEQRMCDLICSRLQDGEAVLEFDPLPPADALLERYQSPGIVTVSGNDTVYVPRNTPGLFARNYCPVCSRAWGERTDMELEVESLPSKSDGAVCLSVPFVGPVFSEAFVNLLGDVERGRLRVLRVHSRTHSPRRFFELLGIPTAPFLGLSGFPGFDASPCAGCGYVTQSHLFRNEVYHFLASEDLPKSLPSSFVAGHRGATLCMTSERWYALRGLVGTHNVVARRVYVIPSRMAVR